MVCVVVVVGFDVAIDTAVVMPEITIKPHTVVYSCHQSSRSLLAGGYSGLSGQQRDPPDTQTVLIC